MDGLTREELEIMAEIHISIEGCRECPFNAQTYGCLITGSRLHNNVEKVKKICAEYKKGHTHTYLEEFRKRFPYSTLEDEDIIVYSLRRFFNAKACEKCYENGYYSENCMVCWNKRYKEEDSENK